MEKLIILSFLLFTSIISTAQNKEFKVPEDQSGHHTLIVRMNDVVTIKEGKAYIVSETSFEVYRELQQKLRERFENGQSFTDSVIHKFEEFDATLSKIDSYTTKWKSLSESVLENTEKDLTRILSDLKSNITDLNNVYVKIAEAQKELDKIENDLRKERRRLAWSKFGKFSTGLASGFVLAALLI